tara:strand:+ start:154 stop:540 length:387 start_codon:yes stop_codon:yes gene_type:complete
MNTEKIKEKYVKYGLEKSDIFKHQHYLIITRSGIERIASYESISVKYEIVKCEPNFAAVKAIASKDGNIVETYGSALKGSSFKDGNTNSYYVLEMAQKRSFSRAVLQLTGMYELGCFGEDESEEFKQN